METPSKLSTRSRKILYLVPILFQWVPGLFFERDGEVQDEAWRGALLSSLMLAMSLAVVLVKMVVAIFNAEGAIYIALGLQSLVAVGYIGLSLQQISAIWKNKPADALESLIAFFKKIAVQ